MTIVYRIDSGQILGQKIFLPNSIMSSRFNTCVRPPWQPPSYVFQYVWPVLYAIYLYTLLTHSNNTRLRDILIIGLVLNLFWVPVFAKNPTFALAILTMMIWLALKTQAALTTRGAQFLFSPYTAWLFFAWTLNAYIAWNCSTQKIFST